MILWLHDWLNRGNNLFDFRFPNWALITASVFAYNIFFQGTINLWVVGVPVLILGFGVFNYPYCYLKNRIKLEIVPRIFKESRFIHYSSYKEHGDLSLNRRNNDAVGMLVGDLIYLDEEEGSLILWGMKNRVRYFKNFSNFLSNEIEVEDNSETIKRKLILKNLTA